MAFAVSLALAAAVLVALFMIATERRRDDLARELARQVFLVDGISEAAATPARLRALFPYIARTKAGTVVVLAPSADAAADLVALGVDDDGAEIAISCLLGRHRVVPLGGGRIAVAALPRWLGFLGKPCEHGGHGPA